VRLPLLPQIAPDLHEKGAILRVLLGGLLDRAAKQREGIDLPLLVDLQETERLTDAMGDQVAVGRGLTFIDAFGDHPDRVDLGLSAVLRIRALD
jgi:hypothetical protein